MLDFCSCIVALHNMKLSYETLAANFDTSTGTISNWINRKIQYPNIKLSQLKDGFMNCCIDLNMDTDVFIHTLINNLDITRMEEEILKNEYNQREYENFIEYLINQTVSRKNNVPFYRTYSYVSTVRPIIGVGQDHVIAVKYNGKVCSCGNNDDQQCNTHEWRNIVSVTGCWKASIGLRADGTVVATGANVIGDGSLFRWTDIDALASGAFHVLGLKADKTVISFGRNPYSQCDVSNWKNIVSIAAGDSHSVGLCSDGTVVAVGHNDQGQCDVHNWKNVKQVVAASDHTLALLNDGTVIGCGNLGVMKLEKLAGANAIATGTMHAVGLMADGCVINTGAKISGLCDVERWHHMVAIAAGFYKTVGVRSDGKVFVTLDNHQPYHLNTCEWKLFDNRETTTLISQFDGVISDLKHKLVNFKQQALKISPYITQYFDLSAFQYEYTELNKLVDLKQQALEVSLDITQYFNLSAFQHEYTELNKLVDPKQQALKVSSDITQYYDNVAILDFSAFQHEYTELKKISHEIYIIYENNHAMPTIERLTMFFLSVFIDFEESLEEREGRFYITTETLNPFEKLLLSIDQLLQVIRMVESGATLT